MASALGALLLTRGGAMDPGARAPPPTSWPPGSLGGVCVCSYGLFHQVHQASPLPLPLDSPSPPLSSLKVSRPRPIPPAQGPSVLSPELSPFPIYTQTQVSSILKTTLL